MTLTEHQKRYLRKLAHPRKVVVAVGGGGLSEGVIAELDQSLAHHELLKVRVSAEDRESRNALIDEMCGRVNATLVQRIGHIAVLYRAADKPRIKLP